MKIQTAATKIISAWEHTGHYDCHGNGAYGLIGWEKGQLVSLLEHYVAAGGQLSDNPQIVAGKEAELNRLAAVPLMQQVQREQAYGYMTSAIEHQWKFYKFKSALAQLIICDIGVNSGIWNHYVEHCNADLSRDGEVNVLYAVLFYRRQSLMKYGIWQKYEGIRRRWQFYDKLWQDHRVFHLIRTFDWGKTAPGQMTVNGVSIQLDEPIVPMAL